MAWHRWSFNPYSSINHGSRCEGSTLGQAGEEAVQRRGRLSGKSSQGFSAGALRNLAQRTNVMLVYKTFKNDKKRYPKGPI